MDVEEESVGECVLVQLLSATLCTDSWHLT